MAAGEGLLSPSGDAEEEEAEDDSPSAGAVEAEDSADGSGVTAASASGALVVRVRPKGGRLLPPLSCGRPRLVKGRRVLATGLEAAGVAEEGVVVVVVVELLELLSPPLLLPPLPPANRLRPPKRFRDE